ncbi:MAG: RNA 2',3'-cyclic phosphodiesterase [Actinomycetes bacterium]
MRLFAAVVPPPEALGDLEAALAPARAEHPGLQWIPRERWHLTLAFYGEVEERAEPRLRRRLARAASACGPLDLRLAGAGHFGRRVLWVGVQGQREGLRALARGVATDDRPYRPHLTVARVRGEVDPRPAATMLKGYGGPGWTAGEVLLVRSHLGPKPRHEPIASWALVGH